MGALLLAGGVGIGAGDWFAQRQGASSNASSGLWSALGTLPVVGAIAAPSTENWLLLGTDYSATAPAGSDYATGGRSDTMIVAKVDWKNHQVTLVSIPRDLQVELPGRGTEKINDALYFGGPKEAEQVVSGLLGIPIDHYAIVNLTTFPKLIDALGGVTVDVPYDVVDTRYGKTYFKAGVHHLNGNQALQYVRIRYNSQGTVGRQDRERQVIEAVIHQLLSPSGMTKLPQVIAVAQKNIQSDLNFSTEAHLATTAMMGVHFQSTDLPGKPAYIDNISWVLVDNQTLQTIDRLFPGHAPMNTSICPPSDRATS